MTLHGSLRLQLGRTRLLPPVICARTSRKEKKGTRQQHVVRIEDDYGQRVVELDEKRYELEKQKIES